MLEDVASVPHGPLASVLAVRTGPDDARTGGIEHREALIYTLGKAAELEHLVMLQYLFAAFSLKQSVDEGLTPETLAAVQRWRKTLLEIGEQEMLHLALVQNLLTAVGAAPRFARPNFPMRAYAFPVGVRIELVPFGEAALRHFAFLERPDGLDVEDAEGFEAIAQSAPLPHDDHDGIVPHLQDFDTIGQLYRSIEAGLVHLDERLGQSRLFIGPQDAQATEEHFRWPELIAVTDVASARRAIDTIVEQGEGARGEWREAHFGRLLGILDEFLEYKRADPEFDPARPVVAANVRPQSNGVVVPLITDPGTTRCMDLLNVGYEVLLQVLSRYFAHSDESPEQLGVLADVSVGLMYTVIKPLGTVVTTLPVGPNLPGVTAGPGFELFYEVDYLLPHKEAAWVLMEERLRDAAAFARRCGEMCTVALMEPLAKVASSLERYADQLGAVGGAAVAATRTAVHGPAEEVVRLAEDLAGMHAGAAGCPARIRRPTRRVHRNAAPVRARISRSPMAGVVPDRSVSVDGDTLVTDGREIEMDRYTRRQYFEGLCRMRDDYGSLGADDTTSCISIEDVIALAIDLLEQPAEPATETNDASKAA